MVTFLRTPVAAVLAMAVGVAYIQRFLFAGPAPPPDFGSGSMFDVIAPRYDFINRVLAVGMDTSWRKRMAQIVKEDVSKQEHVKILDIATGTADVAILLAQEIPDAIITGVDPSRNMLQVGQQKIERQRLDDAIILQLADAMDFASLESNEYDAATMAFGIRNVPDRSQALCQIQRVLKDKSLLCILEFSEPDDSFGVMGSIARFFIRNIVPLVGGVLSGAPQEYWHLQNSIKDFPSSIEFGNILNTVQCPGGSFQLEEIIQMNYGSVQLYVSRTKKTQASQPQSA
jgi:demethylmenaquinone methyltransferase/2-methoxy-6-polyprenyl-1,4-benzoquinol methylase